MVCGLFGWNMGSPDMKRPVLESYLRAPTSTRLVPVSVDLPRKVWSSGQAGEVLCVTGAPRVSPKGLL